MAPKNINLLPLKTPFTEEPLGPYLLQDNLSTGRAFNPFLRELFLSLPMISALETAFSDEVCAILLEPIQGEGGIFPLTKEFLEKVKELCQKFKALLIFDEIQTGIGRTGKLFAYEHFGIEPDILCTSKALANGLPLSAMLAKSEVMQALKLSTHASTFGGNPIACAVALKVLEVVSEKSFLEEVALKGKVLKERLIYLDPEKKIIKEVRGEGLLIGIEFHKPSQPIYETLLKKKILVTQPKPNIIRLTPPLIVNYREFDYFLESLAQSLTGGK